jgi:hypothetical protein
MHLSKFIAFDFIHGAATPGPRGPIHHCAKAKTEYRTILAQKIDGLTESLNMSEIDILSCSTCKTSISKANKSQKSENKFETFRFQHTSISCFPLAQPITVHTVLGDRK